MAKPVYYGAGHFYRAMAEEYVSSTKYYAVSDGYPQRSQSFRAGRPTTLHTHRQRSMLETKPKGTE